MQQTMDATYTDGTNVIAEVLSGPHHGKMYEVSRLNRYHDIDGKTFRLYFVQGFYFLMEKTNGADDSGY